MKSPEATRKNRGNERKVDTYVFEARPTFIMSGPVILLPNRFTGIFPDLSCLTTSRRSKGLTSLVKYLTLGNVKAHCRLH